MSNPVFVLGISGFYHDAAAALVRDGEIVAAAQEERFTRVKHDPGFPQLAIDYCLREGGIEPGDLDAVAFYEKPLTKFERLLETYLSFAPSGFASFRQALPIWLRQKLHLPRVMDRGLRGGFKGRYVFPEHHESHAASAFFPSPFEEAAILTIDGVGEWATAALGFGRGNRVELTHELRFPHSLGLLYSAFTYYTGFKVNSGEYKLMGLAPYGEPRYAELILEKLLDLKEDGSFRLDLQYFNYCQGLTMTSELFHRLFGGPPRQPESPVTDRDMDLAASIQVVTEEIVSRMARHLHGLTGMKNLCLAGGVALNCVANGRLRREGPFEGLWIQPAAGDAGGALGAALLVWHQLMGRERRPRSCDSMQGALLGPAFDDAQIKAVLDRAGACYHQYDDETMLEQVVSLLASEKVVGRLQGRMEFGPRALGSRSILGDARSTRMQSVMNLKIKFRESFRPFAPSVLQEHAHEYFSMDPEVESPYMLLVADVRPDKRVNDDGRRAGLRGMELLKAKRSVVPAITHVDYSARVQTVERDRHASYHRLISRFHEATGCPVVINTSFNVRGEPIVCSPEDALNCFLNTGMDALVMEHFLLLKAEQPASLLGNQEEYLKAFKLD
ncbi:MAG TPA: carbamoyltransferase [Vicinamibacterales bacterium]|nr:carbamoyltransferase [Vicinamibacterales bacterium]